MGDIAPVERTMGVMAIQGNVAVTPPRRQPDANFELGKRKVLTEDEM
jgi:hypothetical protein